MENKTQQNTKLITDHTKVLVQISRKLNELPKTCF